MALQYQTGERDTKSLTCLGQALQRIGCTVNRLLRVLELIHGSEFLTGLKIDVLGLN